MGLTQVSTGGIKNATVATADIADDNVTFEKIENITANQVLGRVASGTGEIQALSGAHVRGIINVADGATNSPTTTINNNADNRVITGSDTANTLNGESGLVYNGYNLAISGTGQQQLNVGSSDAGGAAIILDGNSNGDGAGGDYSLIRHNSSGDLEFYARDPGGATNYIFRTGTSQKFKIAEGGDVEVTDGNLVIGTSGKGIDFSATTNASSSESTTTMANELFDDYEVGSWQPTWKPASGSIGHQSRHGDYIKIGRTVHCMFAISANGSTNPSGELQLSGLPFSATIPNANGTRGGGGVLFAGYHMNSDVTKCVANGTTLYLLKADNSRLQTDSSGIGYGYNAAQLSGMFSYITAS